MRSHLTSRIDAVITAADMAQLLTMLNKDGIDLSNVIQIDEITVQVRFREKELDRLIEIADRYGAQIKVTQKLGIVNLLKRILTRPMLLLAVITPILLTAFLSERIFFIRVEGNQLVPTNLILEKAELAGLGFGTVRGEIRSEKIKNALLEELPNLQWVGVNTSGTVATVSVREKSSVEESKEKYGVSSIIAARDGILLSCNVMKGRRLCQVGQAVEKGQLLVSGFSEQGGITQGCNAEAEITALTDRSIVLLTPLDRLERVNQLDSHKCYGIRIGKKQIKLCNHSGIYDSSCVKMYTEEYWTLPGGFRLPVALVCESVQKFEAAQKQLTEQDNFSWVTETAIKYIASQMVAGKILSERVDLMCSNDLCTLSGNYTCQEMIGQVRDEEILE